MATTVQARDEVIPGYVLDERIGTGGYAEVWRARAPGGIDKAVKIVNGYYDEEFASQEMKALERIKDVRHPFLLSLERFEVVNGRLAILTELADMSLEQRAQECRAAGQIGIPREELLRYMADAAEALDYLTLRHGLQHLDIKPANLLILGDHVKVADFGLVKELTTRTQNSLVAGLTPTYASPEMFDDAPSPQSDQYSLAIVYQELLVGVRAFPGRTAAQLAKQHMQAQPQLSALPAHDRPLVARALAKVPADRFPSCREFIHSLLHATDAPVERRSAAADCQPSPQPTARTGSQSLADTESAAIAATRPVVPTGPPIATQPVGRNARSAAFAPPNSHCVAAELPTTEDVNDVSVPEAPADLCAAVPTLFIGVGGAGIRALSQLREQLAGGKIADEELGAIQMIALDTDRSELKDAYSQRHANPFAIEDTLHLPLRLPQDYGDESRAWLSWLSRRWLYNIPRSLETQGYRPLGRIALVDNADKTLALLDRKLKHLLAKQTGKQIADAATKIRVVLVAGMGGGTGAGMVVDLANAARARARSQNAAAEVTGILVGTCLGSANSSVLAAANTYALLAELHHASTFGNRGALSQSTGEHPFESSEPPFDHVYCVPARSRNSGGGSSDVLSVVAAYLRLERIAATRGALRACRQAPTEKETSALSSFSLRSFGCVRVSEQQRRRIEQATVELNNAVKKHWLQDVPEADWRKLARQVEALLPRPAETSAPSAAPSEPVAPVSVVNPLEQMRTRFGHQQASRFAFEALSALVQHSSQEGGRKPAALTSKRMHDVLGTLSQAIETLSELPEQTVEEPPAKPVGDAATLGKLAEETSCRVMGIFAAEFETLRFDALGGAQIVGRMLAAECTAVLEELSRNPARAGASMLQLEGDDLRRLLQRVSVDLLKCGCDRRTLVIVPKSQAQSAAAPVVTADRPATAVVFAEVEEEIILCEASGIRPKSVAMGLERVYPGIADAAGRLFTRVDIEWRPLV